MKKDYSAKVYLYTSQKNKEYLIAASEKAGISLSKVLDRLVTLARLNKLQVKIDVNKEC